MTRPVEVSRAIVFALVCAHGLSGAAATRTSEKEAVATTAIASPPVLVGETVHPEALFGEICAALHAPGAGPSGASVKVRPGLYLIPAQAGTDTTTAWKFTGENALRHCTLDLAGVTLVFQGSNGTNLEFANCTNAVFEGATVYKQVPSFTQGTLVEVDQITPQLWHAQLALDAGYLQKPFNNDTFTLHVFDSKIKDSAGRAAWKANTAYFHPQVVAVPDHPGLLDLTFAGHAVLDRPNVGDRIVLRGKGGFSTTVSNCTDTTFRDLTLGNNGLYGIVEFSGSRTTYERVRVTYGPPPPGATEIPLVASTADGIHCLYGDPGPTIRDCLIEGTPDDGIAIHGEFFPVRDVVSPRRINLATRVGSGAQLQKFLPGDTLRASDEKTGFYAETTVTGAVLVDGSWNYDLREPIAVQPGYLVSNPRTCGHGYRITGTTVRRNRARGMLLKADDGLVENCTVTDSTIAGIVVSPEAFAGGGEAGYCHGVTLRGNTICHTGYAEVGPWTAYAPGISITGNGSIGNRDITVADNTFEDISGANLLIRFTSGATVTGNRFFAAHERLSHVGEGAGIDPGVIIWLSDSANITLANNRVQSLGPFGTCLLGQKTGSVSGVREVKGGIKLSPRMAVPR